ncbi:hypothetical protein QD46_21975 [Paenibacillus polymyxa]|nr:hypothetical protein [Paenibacillus polymyxa]MCV9948553.1 hypothetical protein [Paenibacillus sp. BT-177]MEB4782805.1 hypothetical protein [Paenibacillus jamilae]KJD38039.1 hypothetical protein QD46_21975 [Paenibacillus polymyxa]MCJ1220274.1 hypothetical protein [Paenibacillus polymyxa]SEJ56637.1 hypothetical protein SAMN04488600_103297 [Paenibacillus polymyxa]
MKENEIIIEDLRMYRKVGVKAENDDRLIIMQDVESFILDGKRVEFTSPNNIAICLSKAMKETDLANSIFDSLIKSKIKNKEVKFNDSETVSLFDYFEHLEVGIIFSYTAVEAFANVAIPEEFGYEIKNNKGIKEIWDKAAIERWMKTTDKLRYILPNILQCSDPCNNKFWSDFKKLEDIRNKLIHQKTFEIKRRDESIYKSFFNESIFRIIKSGFLVIDYFVNMDIDNINFPNGFGEAKLFIEEIDDFHKHWFPIED